MRRAAQEGEIRSDGKFEVTHLHTRNSRKHSVQEPTRIGAVRGEIAIEAGAEQPEAQTAFVLDAEVVARGTAMLAPPGALNALGAFGGDHLVQRPPPFEAQGR